MERPSPHLEGNSVTAGRSITAHADGVISFVQNVLLSYDDVMHTGKGDAAERAKPGDAFPLR